MATQANQRPNFKPKISAPGMWQFPINPDLCCIYRVPDILRQVNPSAYTPQLLIIGPLHRSLKAQALKRLEDIDNSKFMGYLNMEQHKEIYLLDFTQRFGGEDVIAEFRSVIEEKEEAIRASYAESTTWIESKDFVEMILQDSVFILEFILRDAGIIRNSRYRGDVLMQETLLSSTVYGDLMLLENQLPYFILEKLCDPIIEKFYEGLTFRKLVIRYFNLEGKMKNNSKFKHFTDLLRRVRVDSLQSKTGVGVVNGVQVYKPIKNMYNAEKLHWAGIKFKVIKEELSLDLKFKKGCLEVPRLFVQNRSEMVLRNIMALEQCHYPYEAYVCSFLDFLDHLIDADKDVDVLVENGNIYVYIYKYLLILDGFGFLLGIVKNWIGDHGSVADLVNKLSVEIVLTGSYYYDIADKIEAHYKSPINKSYALLKRVYFKDVWTGTATVAAAALLVMTLMQTVNSFK